MYAVRMMKSAARDLADLDVTTGRRIVSRIRWLADNLEDVRLEPLRGDLSGLYKLRQGAYRIIYQVLREEESLIIHSIGHRRDVYRKA